MAATCASPQSIPICQTKGRACLDCVDDQRGQHDDLAPPGVGLVTLRAALSLQQGTTMLSTRLLAWQIEGAQLWSSPPAERAEAASQCAPALEGHWRAGWQQARPARVAPGSSQAGNSGGQLRAVFYLP